jgi:hypothetical protein
LAVAPEQPARAQRTAVEMVAAPGMRDLKNVIVLSPKKRAAPPAGNQFDVS